MGILGIQTIPYMKNYPSSRGSILGAANLQKPLAQPKKDIPHSRTLESRTLNPTQGTGTLKAEPKS